MKKINLKYCLCLICSSILLCATLNVFFFYEFAVNNIECREIILILLPGIFAILSLWIFKWITEKDFELIENNQIEDSMENDTSKAKKKNRKKYVYFWITFLVFILIFGIVSFGEIVFKEKFVESAQKMLTDFASMGSLHPEEIQEFQKEYNLLVTTQDYTDWKTSIIFSCLVFIPVFFVFYIIFIKQKFNKPKVLKKICRCLEIIMASSTVMISIYYFVDIPAFRYSFEIKDEGIVFNGYSDLRDYIKNDSMIVPKKILGKSVVEVGELPYVYNDEIFVPFTLPKKAINFEYALFCDMHGYGEPIEWYEENGVIYNIEGDEILYINTENLYIPESVTKLDTFSFCTASFLKSVEVSPNNKTCYSYDNIIYTEQDIEEDDGKTKLYTIGIIPPLKMGKDAIIPEHMAGDTLYLTSIVSNINVIIPANLNRYIEIENSQNLVLEYKVQEGNTYYEVFEGSLYEKGLGKIVAVCDYSEKGVMKLPKELADFSEVCLSDIIYYVNWNKELKIIIDENNQNFVIEDNLIYNKDKTKLIMPACYMEEIIINKDVKEISEALLESYMNLELSPDNPYFIVDEFGEIQKR